MRMISFSSHLQIIIAPHHVRAGRRARRSANVLDSIIEGGVVNILLAESDPRLSELIQSGLISEGFDIDLVRDGEVAGLALISSRFDAAILASTLPRRDGISLCRDLRARNDDIPILVLGGPDNTLDRVSRLDAGADDCMAPPFDLTELAARLRAIIRRPGRNAEAGLLRVGDISLNLLTRQAFRGDSIVDLTTREFMLLEKFVRHPNQVLTRSKLLSHVWGLDYLGASNVVDVYIRYLRTKLGKIGETRLETVRGAGYRLRTPGAAARLVAQAAAPNGRRRAVATAG